MTAKERPRVVVSIGWQDVFTAIIDLLNRQTCSPISVMFEVPNRGFEE